MGHVQYSGACRGRRPARGSARFVLHVTSYMTRRHCIGRLWLATAPALANTGWYSVDRTTDRRAAVAL